jgi:UDPglucose--hexose-1-phosphate uridylyltransferase
MSEIRQDFLLSRWVIIAENRADRPNEFVAPRLERRGGACPFCPGHEDQTPRAIAVRRPPNWNGDESDWRVRVVSNLYPAVGFESVACQASAERVLSVKKPNAAWPDLRFAGEGFHEVVIDTPEHIVSLGEMTDQDAVELFDVFRERLEAMRAAKTVSSALVFKNVGAAAGASIEHAHSQILATRRPIPDPSLEWTLSRDYYEREGVSAFRQMIDEELALGERIVEENSLAVVLCPFASRFPYEMWVLPRGRFAHLANCPPQTLAAMAVLTRRAIVRLERILDRPAYNFVIHNAPLLEPEAAHFDWHVEIYPRITSWAGFEVGGGCYINPVSPEHAAERLRRAL